MRLIDADELLKAMDTWDKFGVDANTKIVPVKDCYVPYVHYDDMVKAVKGIPTVELNRVKSELKAELKDKMLKYGFTAPDMTVTEFVEDFETL